MIATLADARDRLAALLDSREGSRLNFLLGSGVSNAVLPDTSAFADMFAEKLRRPRQDLSHLSPADRFRLLADELLARQGPNPISQIVEESVLTAYKGELPRGFSLGQNPTGVNLNLFNIQDWNISEAHKQFAKYYRAIPQDRRGAILTTNFDPLIEVALLREGIPAKGYSLSRDGELPTEASIGDPYVIHLHGDWANGAPLATQANLERPRPQLERTLDILMRNSVTVVTGYGGWEDAFSRALLTVLEAGDAGSMRSEVLWMNYSPVRGLDELPKLAQRLFGSYGFQVYCGIPADQVFAVGAAAPQQDGNNAGIPGWMKLTRSAPDSGSIEEVREFIYGAQPTLSIASTVPILSASSRVIEECRNPAPNGAGRLVILAGPTGEGKSAALLQAARAVADGDDCACLVRQAGAPRMTWPWLESIASGQKQTYLFIDEADLVLSDLTQLLNRLRGKTEMSVTFVLALHSHYLVDKRIERLRSTELNQLIPFSGLTSQDAAKLAEFWKSKGLIEGTAASDSVDHIQETLLGAASTDHGSSLFGAVLHLWAGEGLVHRLEDLLDRLSRYSHNDIPFDQILYCIAQMQDVNDPDGLGNGGMSVRGLAAMLEIDYESVATRVIDPLGREAGISRIDEWIYVRHPAMIEPLLETMSSRGDSADVFYRIGLAGGRVKENFPGDGSAGRSFSHMYEGLAVAYGKRAALFFAGGMKAGSPRLLETRVTYLSMLRKTQSTDFLWSYLEWIRNSQSRFYDWERACRGLLVEGSVILRTRGDSFGSAKWAVDALGDSSSTFMSESQAAYALDCLVRSVNNLEHLPPQPRRTLAQSSRQLLSRLPSGQRSSLLVHRTEEPNGYLLRSVIDNLSALGLINGTLEQRHTFRTLTRVLTEHSAAH